VHQKLLVAQRDPKVGGEDIQSAKRRGGYADHCEGVTGNIDSFTDDGAISAKTIRPEVVTQDHDGSIFLVAVKASAQSHWNPADIEVVEFRQCAPNPHRLRGAADGGWQGRIKRGQPRK
jgi:hypothetical protein